VCARSVSMPRAASLSHSLCVCVRVERNWFSDIGIFGKQTSCYFQVLSLSRSLARSLSLSFARLLAPSLAQSLSHTLSLQALSANASIVDNVCVNVPRAGITFNDQAYLFHRAAL